MKHFKRKKDVKGGRSGGEVLAPKSSSSGCCLYWSTIGDVREGSDEEHSI